MFGGVCARHGFPLHLMNTYQGEKYLYGDTIIDKVLEGTEACNTYIFYDIVCQFKKHLHVCLSKLVRDC